MPILAACRRARWYFNHNAKHGPTCHGRQWLFSGFSQRVLHHLEHDECTLLVAKSGVQNRVFWTAVTHQDSLKQGIFFGWQRVAGGHFCITTKIGGLFHPVNLIFTTKPRGHKRRVDPRSRDHLRQCCSAGSAATTAPHNSIGDYAPIDLKSSFRSFLVRQFFRC